MNHKRSMKSSRCNHEFRKGGYAIALILSCLLALGVGGSATAADTTPRTFSTPEEAARALIKAAETYDVQTLEAIFGPDGKAIIHTGEPARDREIAKQFAEQARANTTVSIGPSKKRAVMIIGNDEWPFPVPLVKTGASWSFDSKAGLNEILMRRIGRDELDAIQLLRGFVEAQNEY